MPRPLSWFSRLALALILGLGLAACDAEWGDDDRSQEAHSPSSLDPEAIPGRYGLVLWSGASESQVQAVAEGHGLDVLDFDGLGDTALLGGREGDDALELLEALGQEDVVEWAEPDIAVGLDLQPDDWREALWAFHNTGVNGGQEGADIRAFAAWDETLGGGVVVALVDSGVDSGHSDLTDRLWVNPNEVPGNGIDDDGNRFVDDVHGWDFAAGDADPRDEVGHGTSVGSLVVGRGNDATGVLGAAWGARLMVLRAVGGLAGGNDSAYAISRAFRYAAAEGADLVVAALSTPGHSQILKRAAEHLNARGIPLVTSAGNEARDLDAKPLFPACWDLPHIVTVTSSDRRDLLVEASGTGRGCVDLAAPGGEIIAAYLTNDTGGNRYGTFTGTSLAVPFVAGGLALAWSAAPELSGVEVIEAVLEGVSPLAEGSEEVASGGRLNLEAAVNNALAAGKGEKDARNECVPIATLTCGETVTADTSDAEASTTDAMDDYSCRVGNYRGSEASWDFVASVDGTYTWTLVDAVPTELDNDVFVLSGESGVCRALNCLDKGGYGPNQTAFDAVAGERFFLVVDGYDGAVGAVKARLDCPEAGP